MSFAKKKKKSKQKTPLNLTSSQLKTQTSLFHTNTIIRDHYTSWLLTYCTFFVSIHYQTFYTNEWLLSGGFIFYHEGLQWPQFSTPAQSIPWCKFGDPSPNLWSVMYVKSQHQQKSLAMSAYVSCSSATYWNLISQFMRNVSNIA